MSSGAALDHLQVQAEGPDPAKAEGQGRPGAWSPLATWSETSLGSWGLPSGKHGQAQAGGLRWGYGARVIT